MERTTTLKHLYKKVEVARSNYAMAVVLSEFKLRTGASVTKLHSMNTQELIDFAEDTGNPDLTVSINSINHLRLWHSFGCQTLSLDERTVDMLACTEAPDLKELVRFEEQHTPDYEGWKIPYPSFAIELPYATSIKNMGNTEYFRVATCMPFLDRESGEASWSLLYMTPEDVAGKRTSISNGNEATKNMITNLCIFLNEGGHRTKASKRIGMDKAAQKAKSKVNIWNVRTPTNTPLPLGIAKPYLTRGEVPPKTFRVGKRFMVRGHYRNQPCGEGNKDRTRIWIKPHLKGPEECEAFSRVYQVKA
jgi:hypothetical protein